MRPLLLLLACLAAGTASTAAAPAASVRVAEKLPNSGRNDYYQGNRAPLLPSALIKLPIGSVRPRGWLGRQLELMGEGFTGHLSEISAFCKLEGNAWGHPQGEGDNGWEEAPYWLKGYYNLGHVVKDERILGEARRWLDAVLASQRPDGWFGAKSSLEGGRISEAAAHGWPPSMRGKVPDLWPNMVMLYPLRSYYEATGDKRILEFLLKYFRWQHTIPLEYFIPFSWQNWRAGDNLDLIYWLYNQTGEGWLLDLARVTHERMANWTGGVASWHVVNIAQCFRAPGQYYQQTGDVRYLRASERNYDTVRGLYGQTPGGLYGADENARPGFTGPRQGTETCAMVEILYSHTMLAAISGESKWLDRAEDVAFNSLPAAMTPDLKGLHYLTAPNQIQLDRGNKSPAIQNAGQMFAYDPHLYRCCQHNVAFGWPYFAEHAWMAAPGNGLAAVYYTAGEVTAKVGDGRKAAIRTATDYPFGETVSFTVSPEAPVRFPLILRIPGWCESPALRINGKDTPLPPGARGWAVIDRTWRAGDVVEWRMPMRLHSTVWAKNRGTVSVHHGPLTYSLQIGEQWRKSGGTEKWPGYEVFPTTPWNYALAADPRDLAASMQVVRKPGPVAAQPFTQQDAPIQIRAKGRRVPEWKQEPNGLVGEVQQSPVLAAREVEDITLIPMGCARLRISAFPQPGDGPGAHRWEPNQPLILASSASHFEPPTVIADGIAPKHSADMGTPRFAFSDAGQSYPPRRGLLEYAEYQFPWPRTFRRAEVYWAADEGIRPQCRLPLEWRILWWDGKEWRPVEARAPYETRRDAPSAVQFAPVETTRLRLRVEVDPRATAGLYEWRVD